MTQLVINVFLALIWSSLLGNFEPLTLISGFILGFFILMLIQKKEKDHRYFQTIPNVLKLILFLIKEIFASNYRLATTILSPKMKLKPGIIAIPLDMTSEIGIVLMANMITLTPGTLSMDISTKHKFLYLHVYDLQDPQAFIEDIKYNYERRIQRIFE